MTDKDKEKILEMRRQGISVRNIAKELNISAGTVGAFIARLKQTGLVTKCKYCGCRVYQKQGHRRKEFCSEECRRGWRKINQDKRNLTAFYSCICKECGREFRAYGVKNRVYCSWDCYMRSRRGENND